MRNQFKRRLAGSNLIWVCGVAAGLIAGGIVAYGVAMTAVAATPPAP